MFAPAHHAQFSLTIGGIEHDFKVKAFKGLEAISQPFQFDLELVSERSSIDLEVLLHKPAFLQISTDGTGIHGLISRAAKGNPGKRLHAYDITLRPCLAYLARRVNVRIFQRQTVDQIIAQVLATHGILSNTFRFELRVPCPEREYCVQYNESDLDFIHRLCAEEGIHYHFRHSTDGHLLMFGDDQTIFPKLSPLPYKPASGLVADTPVVSSFRLQIETRSSRTTYRDYHFEKPALDLEASSDTGPLPDLEAYVYPGRFIDRERGKLLAERALERYRIDYTQARGASDQHTLSTGHYLPMTEHPRAALNDLWLINEIIHTGKQPQVLEESAGISSEDDTDGFQQGYKNLFLATPWDLVYRPTAEKPKPRILGTQTAIVTGPQAEEIHCDQYGRVKVQFHWDREGQRDDHSSCWLRVTSGWAGAHYGGIAIPRVGMEVLVSFLEGDPDQPLISGCLYYGDHAVAYDLPPHKTRSVFRSLSSPGGEGSNELRIEDLSGQEQIYLRAQRDWDLEIEHHERIHVGNQRHDSVQANSYSEFKAEEHHTVHGERKVDNKTSDHLSVGQSQHIQLGDGQFTDAGLEIHLDSGLKIVLEAGSELILKAAGHFVKIDSSGVVTSAPIMVGGMPGQGSGAAPLLPGPLQQADSDRPGELLMPTQRSALAKKKLLCPMCEAAKKEFENDHP